MHDEPFAFLLLPHDRPAHIARVVLAGVTGHVEAHRGRAPRVLAVCMDLGIVIYSRGGCLAVGQQLGGALLVFFPPLVLSINVEENVSRPWRRTEPR